MLGSIKSLSRIVSFNGSTLTSRLSSSSSSKQIGLGSFLIILRVLSMNSGVGTLDSRIFFDGLDSSSIELPVSSVSSSNKS